MIDVYDFLNKGRTHLPFNSAFLSILAAAYPNRAVRIAAHASHIAALGEMDLPTSVRMLPLPDAAFQSEHSRTSIRNTGAIRHLQSAPLAPNVVIMGARAWFLSALLSDKRLLSTSAFDIVFHATLAEQAKWRSRNPFVRRSDLFSVLGRRMPSTLRFIVLEGAIGANLRRLVRPETRSIVLEHPAGPANHVAARARDGSRPRIAFIGAPTKAKGFPAFAAAAQAAAGRFDFEVVGGTAGDCGDIAAGAFARASCSEKLSQPDFDARVADADLVCLPLDPVHYGWSASGSLVDCIRLRVPPVTTRTPVVEDLARRYGEFGYIVPGACDMPAFIAALDARRVAEDAPRFRAALDRIAADRSIAALAGRFRLNEA